MKSHENSMVVILHSDVNARLPGRVVLMSYPYYWFNPHEFPLHPSPFRPNKGFQAELALAYTSYSIQKYPVGLMDGLSL